MFSRLYLCILLPGLEISGVSARAQQATFAPQSAVGSVVDVVVWVQPLAPDAAQVALSYRKRVPHPQVRSAIAALAKASGGTVSGIQIEDDSFKPADLKRFPVVTSAEFALRGAPIVQDNAPVLRPYLQAFQGWDRLEAIFTGLNLVPYRGLQEFQSPALAVQLLQQGEGIYRYRVEIHDHKGALPTLPLATGVNSAPPTPTVVAPKPARTLNPLVFLLAGLGLCGGVATYFLLARRPAAASSRRSAHRPD